MLKESALAKLVCDIKKTFALLPTASRNRKISVITNFVERLDAIDKPRGFIKFSKYLRNELLSLKDGIKNGCVSNSEMRLTTLDSISICDNTESDNPNSENFDTLLKEINESSFDLLEKSKIEPVVIAKTSIIPIASFNESRLLREKFNITKIQGCIVLHNQVVIGINKSLMEKTKWHNKKGVYHFSSIIQEIVDSLSESTGSKHILICPKPYSFKNAMNVNWYWVMPMHEANKLVSTFKSSYGNSTSITNWGLTL